MVGEKTTLSTPFATKHLCDLHLARLPPTEEAAAQHSYRTFHQVQKWLGVNLEPTNWGWKSSHQGLIPVMSTKEPAPLTLLKFLSCSCKKGCTGRNCTLWHVLG
uniref:Uncharacterized protein n=1 Tax=Cacopsylla melanoneura TaxID=428564 RepID=A0A8D8RS01_9HEMI